MKSKFTEFTPVSSRPARRRPGRPRHNHAASDDHARPEAFDEIFTHLAERQEQVERQNQFALDAQRIREMASELDRQRERLAQLLRDIDLSA